MWGVSKSPIACSLSLNLIMKLSFLIFVSILIASCGSYVEYNRTYCSDGSKYLLKYDYNIGATDGGRDWRIAFLHSTDPAKYRLSKNSISNRTFDDIYWKGNDTVIIEENYIEFMREGKSNFKDSIITINTVPVKIIQKDPLDFSYTRQIIYQKTSPDNQYDLIIYRYSKPDKNNITVHMSVVHKNDSIPKYGNFYITKDDFNCFKDVRWDSLSNLDIKVSEACTSGFTDCLVSKRLDIKYKTEIIPIEKEDSVNGNVKEYY